MSGESLTDLMVIDWKGEADYHIDLSRNLTIVTFVPLRPITIASISTFNWADLRVTAISAGKEADSTATQYDQAAPT